MPFQVGCTVIKWPETLALLERLGVELGQNVTGVSIHIPLNDVARVEVEQLAVDAQKESKSAS